MIDYQDARKVAGVLSAIGEPTRIQILNCLTAGPHYVGQLAERVGIPMVNMSHHLGVLRQAGLIMDTKVGRRVNYMFSTNVYEPAEGTDHLGKIRVGNFVLHLPRIPTIFTIDVTNVTSDAPPVPTAATE